MEKVVIKIPTGWNEVTIKQYLEVKRQVEFLTEKLIEEGEFIYELVKILSNTPDSVMRRLEFKQVNLLYKRMKGQFLDTEIPQNIQKEFVINGVKYISPLDITKIKAGQYIDICESIKEDKKNLDNKVHEIMSVFYVPEGKKYDQVPTSEIAETFYNHLTIDLAYNTAVFFYLVWMDLIKNTKEYMVNKARIQMREAVKDI